MSNPEIVVINRITRDPKYENHKKSKDFWKKLFFKRLGTAAELCNSLAVPVPRKKP